MMLTPSRIVLLLVAVAIVASLATVATIGGVVIYAAMRPTPTVRPAIRAPVAPAVSAPKSSVPDLFGSDHQRQQDQRAKESCDKQWRNYQEQYNEYLSRKSSGGSFNLAPSKPWC